MLQVRRAGTVTARIAMIQFDWDRPEIKAIFEDLDVPPNYGYFLLRAAPLGRCNPQLIGSAMAFFPPQMVAKIVERLWERAGPQETMEIGVRQMSVAAQAVLGDGDGVAELAELYDKVLARLDTSGRILSSAWRTVPWPDRPACQLLGAATTLREYRGDGHIAAVAASGVSPLQARILSAATAGVDPEAKAASFGWKEPQIDEAMAGLREMGVIDGAEATVSGRELWEDIEELTDRLAAPAWEPLGEDLTRLVALGEEVLEAGEVPAATGR
ncbi:MAG: hypothetical protein ACE5E8_07510 [Acidimicrobiia bacterium]